MSGTVFSNQSHHKQILDFIKRILIERKDYEPLSDIFRPRPIKGETLREKNFFKVDFIHLFTTKRGNLLFSEERRAIFYKKFLDFVRLRQRMGHNQRYLYRLFPQGEKGAETFSVEALRMLDRLTWHILRQFEEEAMKKYLERKKHEEKVEEELKILMGKWSKGEVLLVLNAEGLKALRAGVPVSEIIDNGLVTVVDESGVLPPDIGRDENGGIFPITKLLDEDGDLATMRGISWKETEKYFAIEKTAVIFGTLEKHGLLIEDLEMSGNEIRGTYIESGEPYSFSLDLQTNVFTITSANGEKKETPFPMFLDEMEQYTGGLGAEETLARRYAEELGIKESGIMPFISGMKFEGGEGKMEMPIAVTEERTFPRLRDVRVPETPKHVESGTEVIRKIPAEDVGETPENPTAQEESKNRQRPNVQGEDGQAKISEPNDKKGKAEEAQREQKIPSKQGETSSIYMDILKMNAAVAGGTFLLYEGITFIT